MTDPGFLRKRRQPNWPRFSRKLHENARNWTKGDVPGAPVDPPMLLISKLNILETWTTYLFLSSIYTPNYLLSLLSEAKRNVFRCPTLIVDGASADITNTGTTRLPFQVTLKNYPFPSPFSQSLHYLSRYKRTEYEDIKREAKRILSANFIGIVKYVI